MKKLFTLLVLFVVTNSCCSDDYEDPCLCWKVTDMVTFQEYDSDGRVRFRSQGTAENVCSGETIPVDRISYYRIDTPKLGECLKEQ